MDIFLQCPGFFSRFHLDEMRLLLVKKYPTELRKIIRGNIFIGMNNYLLDCLDMAGRFTNIIRGGFGLKSLLKVGRLA